MNLWILIGYYCLGALLDVLATIDVIAVQKRKAAKSATVSFISTVVSYVAFYWIMNSPEYLTEIMFYALGGSIGAYFIIKRTK